MSCWLKRETIISRAQCSQSARSQPATSSLPPVNPKIRVLWKSQEEKRASVGRKCSQSARSRASRSAVEMATSARTALQPASTKKRAVAHGRRNVQVQRAARSDARSPRERLRLWPCATTYVELDLSAPSHRCRRGARGPREVPEVVTCLSRRPVWQRECGDWSCAVGDRDVKTRFRVESRQKDRRQLSDKGQPSTARDGGKTRCCAGSSSLARLPARNSRGLRSCCRSYSALLSRCLALPATRGRGGRGATEGLESYFVLDEQLR